MAFILRIITPERVAYEGTVTSVTLPTMAGEIEILDGHLPIIGVLEPGTILYTECNQSIPIAIDAGFFKFSNDKLLVLVEAAIDVQSVDAASIDLAIQRAKEALESAKHAKQIDEDELERLDKILRFTVAQKVTKQTKRS
jgi:F-type H+-transporting ATPase subunit epsilon